MILRDLYAMEIVIRFARRDELASLPEIERQAGQRFQQLEELAGLADDTTPMRELLHAFSNAHVWVAATPDGSVVGFAYGAVVDGNFHLEELSVLPEMGRRGIGKALVHAVIRHAHEAGFPAVTLTTFRHVAWNAPFYAKLGFRIVPPVDLTPGLAAAFRDEALRGLPIAIRVVMRLEVC